MVRKLRVVSQQLLMRSFLRIIMPAPRNDIVCDDVEERTRDKAGENEKKDIQAIVAALNTPNNPVGIKLKQSFAERFEGLEIVAARERSGNRAVHYDFEIQFKSQPNVWFRIEHKGSQHNIPISPTQTPWSAGVQFHNGGCEKYSIAKLYARTWYDLYIGSGALTAEFGLEAPIPSFDQWFANDAKVQGDPKTAFGIELKKKVRDARGPRASLLEKREAANAAFKPTPADVDTFKKEALNILNEALHQKDYWLTIHGSIADGAGIDDFHCAWYPKFTIDIIHMLTIRKEKDIWFDFYCDGFRFSSILRWGKGAGFSNLRMDARDTVGACGGSTT
jgi:hypothetical protein